MNCENCIGNDFCSEEAKYTIFKLCQLKNIDNVEEICTKFKAKAITIHLDLKESVAKGINDTLFSTFERTKRIIDSYN